MLMLLFIFKIGVVAAGIVPSSFRFGLTGSYLVGRELHDLIRELEVADDRVVQSLGADLVVADVVRCPPGAELGAASRQLADQVREVAVVGVAAGLGAKVCDEVLGGPFPVGVELLRG